ncbi:peroxidase P7-like [Malania oleifera]|uniref:peroxidase P7-like n=1 Tax=Malania oleifera TaxID=397392 RepID=UPI0025AE5E12|nr:peroxidase P7-like [Malania oleifera]
MAASQIFFFMCLVIVTAIVIPSTYAQLNPSFYEKTCPTALTIIKSKVQQAIGIENRMGASLVRLHFHDCFVNGCDGSILLDDTPGNKGEKNAGPNAKSARGFEVMDEIKGAVESECKGVVSCADILAVAARDSIEMLGGLYYPVPLGRRDAQTASFKDANNNLPAPTFNLSRLLSSFAAKGLNSKDLVVLSAAHTLGFARCVSFKNRIQNDTNIAPDFAAQLAQNCPKDGSGDNNLHGLDETPDKFDTKYFENLMEYRGLLTSDQQLYDGNFSNFVTHLVMFYRMNSDQFRADFADSMIKMGKIQPLTGSRGEIRKNCRRVN